MSRDCPPQGRPRRRARTRELVSIIDCMVSGFPLLADTPVARFLRTPPPSAPGPRPHRAAGAPLSRAVLGRALAAHDGAAEARVGLLPLLPGHCVLLKSSRSVALPSTGGRQFPPLMLHVLVAATVLLSLIAGLLLLRGKVRRGHHPPRARPDASCSLTSPRVQSSEAERAQSATQSMKNADAPSSAPKGDTPAAEGRKAAAVSRRKRVAEAERSIRAHPLFRSALKGHSKAISDVAVSTDGKAVATASEDRTVRVYVASTIARPTAEHQFVMCKMDLDEAVGIAFLPSGRTLACAMRDARRIDVVALPPSRRERPRIKHSFPADGHSATLRGIVAAPPPRDAQSGATVGAALLLTHAGPPDTGVRAWTPRGDAAASVRTNLVENNAVAARPDGRLVAAAGFASDLRLLAVERRKGSGECRALRPTSSLQGHKVRGPPRLPGRRG